MLTKPEVYTWARGLLNLKINHNEHELNNANHSRSACTGVYIKQSYNLGVE